MFKIGTDIVVALGPYQVGHEVIVSFWLKRLIRPPGRAVAPCYQCRKRVGPGAVRANKACRTVASHEFVACRWHAREPWVENYNYCIGMRLFCDTPAGLERSS